MNFQKVKKLLCITMASTLLLCSCSRQSNSNLQNGTDPSPTPAASPSQTPAAEQPQSRDWSKAKAGEEIKITKNNITCTINSASGLLTRVESDKQIIDMEGVVIDIGYNEKYSFSQLGYTSLEDKATWELPLVWPKLKPLPEYEFAGLSETEKGFIVTLKMDSLIVEYHYTMLDNALQLSAVIKSTEKDNQLINGAGFIVKGYQELDKSKTTAEFPGSTPQGIIALSKYNKYSAVSSDYACPVICFSNNEKNVNVLFVDEQEKWTASFYSDENDKACSVFLAAVEGYIKAGDEMHIGNMYIQLLEPEADPYLAVQDFWTELGYKLPEDGLNDGPVYSAHPYGTMDTGYFNKLTLQEYANQLEKIAAMGFKNVWLLPIFYHTGSNVYEPIDQGVIDERYGGEEGAAAFIEKAHKLGLRVMFDFVPHGPRPIYPFAKEHDDWISKKRDGSNQIEWECVSFDYNNPAYYSYNVELAAYYASSFGLDGARIDCSMGGLSNWQPVEGYRPSSSGLAAGLNVTKAIREGFIKGGKDPILLPENFHPHPAYAAYTDIFYDMPLYRTMHNLNHAKITETEYVQTLQHWLEAERKTSVKGQVKLRFLGNHDTVTWTFDAQRAQSLYGVKKAKALWSLLSLIDGVPYIYQGDEDPARYNLKGENLEEFFTGLFAARSKFIADDYDISYIYTDTPVFAFTRANESKNDCKLVLINLSESSNCFTLDLENPQLLYADGNYKLEGAKITLEPYSTVIIQK